MQVNTNQIATLSINIQQPDGVILPTTYTAKLDAPELPIWAKTGHIVPQLSTAPLFLV